MPVRTYESDVAAMRGLIPGGRRGSDARSVSELLYGLSTDAPLMVVLMRGRRGGDVGTGVLKEVLLYIGVPEAARQSLAVA